MVKNKLMFMMLLLAAASISAFTVKLKDNTVIHFEIDKDSTNAQLYDEISSVTSIPRDELIVLLKNREVIDNDEAIDYKEIVDAPSLMALKRKVILALPAMSPADEFIASLGHMPVHEKVKQLEAKLREVWF